MNNQENKNKQQQQEAGKEGARGKAPQTGFKSFFAKRWTFPVIYLAASVLIVGLMYAKSKDASFEIKKQPAATPSQTQVGPAVPNNDQAATPSSSAPSFMWPVGDDGASATLSMGFYNSSADDNTKAQAVVSYDNKFIPHEGVDIGLKSDKPFTVVAAAKGKVVAVTEDPLMGNTVEIDNGNGYSTYYASLSDVEVQEGAMVIAGQPIAKSGNDEFEKSEMNHLHFEVRKDGVQIDPNSVLSKMPIGDATKSSTNGTTPAAPTSSQSGKAATTTNATKDKSSAAATATGASTDSNTSSAATTSSDSQATMDKATTPATGDQSSAADSSTTDSSTQGQSANTSTDNPNEADGQGQGQ